jgi:chromosome segregation ATPase
VSKDDLDARMQRLAHRISETAKRASEPLTRPRATPSPVEQERSAELLARVEAAEGSANLQALRCAALEDQIALLQATIAELRKSPSVPLVDDLHARFQAALLEIDRLTSERDALRRSAQEWRTKARERSRDSEQLEQRLTRAEAELARLREREAKRQHDVEELERRVAEQRRELELAERRAAHLRRHLNS